MFVAGPKKTRRKENKMHVTESLMRFMTPSTTPPPSEFRGSKRPRDAADESFVVECWTSS